MSACPRCHGTGKIDVVSFVDSNKTVKNSCSICKGSGVLPNTDERDVALIRAGLEAGAKECEGMKVKPMFASNSFPHAESGFNEGVHEAAKAIRALSPESILEEWKGGGK